MSTEPLPSRGLGRGEELEWLQSGCSFVVYKAKGGQRGSIILAIVGSPKPRGMKVTRNPQHSRGLQSGATTQGLTLRLQAQGGPAQLLILCAM